MGVGLLTGEALEIEGDRRTGGGGCGVGQEGTEEQSSKKGPFHSAEYSTLAHVVSINHLLGDKRVNLRAVILMEG